jgi:hypothetical protein
MTAHTELQIHKTGVQLLALVADVQAALPRTFRHYGNRIGDEVTDLLVAIARANAAKGARARRSSSSARAPGRRADHASRRARQAPDLARSSGHAAPSSPAASAARRRLAQGVPQRACSMTVKVVMPVRELNLVEPLPHEGTAMRTTETAARAQARSGAVSPLIGASLRPGDVDSSTPRSTRPTTPGCRTSRTATATSTTRTTSSALSPSADSFR